jgi:hypothetical protein
MATYNAYDGEILAQGKGYSASRFSDQDIQSAFQRMQNDPGQMTRFLQYHQLTPERAAKALGANGMETVNAYVAQNPQMQDWMQGKVQYHDYTPPEYRTQPTQQNYNSPATPAGTPQPMQLQSLPQPMTGGNMTTPGPQPMTGGNMMTPGGTMQGPTGGMMPPPGGQTGGGMMPPNPFGGMNGGMGGNPYLNSMAGNLARTATNTLQRQVLPGIRGQAVAAGGVGGSRQGVAEGLAVGGTMDALGGALTNLYGNAYGQDQQYDLANQRIGLDTYNSNQQWMRAGQNDQLNALNMMMGWQGQGVNLANQQQQQPMQNWQQFANTGSQLGGMGASNTQTMQGNPWLGALGGMQLGTKLFGG